MMKPQHSGLVDDADGMSARGSAHDGAFSALLGVPVPTVNGQALDPFVLTQQNCGISNAGTHTQRDEFSHDSLKLLLEKLHLQLRL
jgi:hypothetical protein